MRPICTKIATILFVFTALASCHAENTKTFGGSYKWPSRPFYAEMVTRVERSGHRFFADRRIIWYRDAEHYRVEIIDCPGKGCHTYLIRSGTCAYSTQTRLDSPEKAKWLCCPVSWMDQYIVDPYIDRKWQLEDPVFLGVEKLHELKAEHWVGRVRNKRPIADRVINIWVSADPRLPLVLKVDLRSTKYKLHREITDLRLNQPMPSCLFTSQTTPQGGLLAQLKMPYKPLWMILLWYALILATDVWLIRALMRGKNAVRKALSVTAAGIAMLGLLLLAPLPEQYINQLSGLPVLILINCMVAAALLYAAKWFPIPGGTHLFAGTRWPVAVWVLIAAGVGLLLSTSRIQIIASRQYGVSLHGLPFLPQTLITVVVYTMIWVTLEEVVFRGYITGLLQRRFSSFWVVNLLQAAVFTVEHISKMLRVDAPGSRTILSLMGIFIFGLIFGQLRLKYRNLSAPWLVHMGYNIGALYATYAGFYNLFTTTGSR